MDCEVAVAATVGGVVAALAASRRALTALRRAPVHDGGAGRARVELRVLKRMVYTRMGLPVSNLEGCWTVRASAEPQPARPIEPGRRLRCILLSRSRTVRSATNWWGDRSDYSVPSRLLPVVGRHGRTRERLLLAALAGRTCSHRIASWTRGYELACRSGSGSATEPPTGGSCSMRAALRVSIECAVPAEPRCASHLRLRSGGTRTFGALTLRRWIEAWSWCAVSVDAARVHPGAG